MYNLTIPNVAKLMASAWIEAECTAGNLAFCWRETTITDLMASLLRMQARQEELRRELEAAFARDLVVAFPDADRYAAEQVAHGLQAWIRMTIPFATIAEEARHGGDLAIVITRPEVSGHGDRLTQSRRGLLVQAKMQGEDGAIGRFTRRQGELFRKQPERRQYSAVVLYPWRDGAHSALDPFRWLLLASGGNGDAEGDPLTQKSGALAAFVRRAARAGRLLSSAVIINCLFAGTIGTDDASIIAGLATSLQTIEITVGWPPNAPPPSDSIARLTQGSHQYPLIVPTIPLQR